MERYKWLEAQIANLETEALVQRLWILGGFPEGEKK